jgi:hypothetical protein
MESENETLISFHILDAKRIEVAVEEINSFVFSSKSTVRQTELQDHQLRNSNIFTCYINFNYS